VRRLPVGTRGYLRRTGSGVSGRGAGLEIYSVFEKGNHVFQFIKVDDPDAIQEVMTESEAQAEWDEVINPILEDGDDPWIEEVYRMV